MYRDEPLDDEAELREILGDAQVDPLLARPDVDDERTPMLAALDVLRLLQGWVDEERAARWFTSALRRLDDRTPIEALAVGDFEDVEEAARAFAAAQG
ncbi:MAG: hypothetical protein ACI970_000077 [Myxococcota bacterium]|jgi:hypothetical protein